jgi:ABC-type lipoprotein release transport system permease subunit
MNHNAFWHFLTLQLFKERSKHISVVIISVLIIFLLSAVLFISSSIRYSLDETLKVQPDFVVNRLQGGNPTSTPSVWIDKLLEIHGISDVSPRVYGRYYFEPKGISFLIVGVDFLDVQSHQHLEKLIEKTPLRSFLDGRNMLIGDGVRAYLDAQYYHESYKFITPKGKNIEVRRFATLPSQSNLMANDMILMPIELAKEILGLKQDEVTDITFNVPNTDEWERMTAKLSSLYYDLNVVNKYEVQKGYENLYNYKGGLFLVLYLIVLATFALILYGRYSMIYSTQKRHIGLLRALGWRINDVLKLKFIETLIIIVTSFIFGVIIAYMYVFICGAPILKEIFVGGENLHNVITFTPVLDFSLLSSLFLLYALPFMAAVLIPVWRISVTDPKEAML